MNEERIRSYYLGRYQTTLAALFEVCLGKVATFKVLLSVGWDCAAVVVVVAVAPAGEVW